MRDIEEEFQRARKAATGRATGRDWAPGAVFSCFEDEATCTVGKKLGNGQFGEVFVVEIAFREASRGDASDRAMWRLREPVLAGALSGSGGGKLRAAMKTATGPAVASGGSSMSAVLAEAVTWMMLPPHPDVVDILHTEMVDGDCVIFAEMVEGKDLDGLFTAEEQWSALAEAPHASEEQRVHVRLSLAHQMASGLDHVHASQMAHFDVKPANVMLALSSAHAVPDAKVCDFGLAQFTSLTEPVKLLGGSRFWMDKTYTSCEADRTAPTAERPMCASHDGFALAITILQMWGGGCVLTPSASAKICVAKWLLDFFPAGGTEARRAPTDAIDAMPEQAPPLPAPLRRALASMLSTSWADRPPNLAPLISAIEESAPGGRASLVPPDDERATNDAHQALTRTYATIMRGLSLSEMVLGLDDGASAHRATLHAARERMETGLAELALIARGRDATVTLEGEADDDASAQALEDVLVAPVHRRLGHVLLTLATLGRDSDDTSLDLESVADAVIHFQKADAAVDDMVDDNEEDRLALSRALEQLAETDELTLELASRILPTEAGGGGEGTEALQLAAARTQLSERARAMMRTTSAVDDAAGTPSTEFKPGALLVLRGSRARGCLEPTEVGQLAYRIPREYKPLRVFCQNGSSALYRMGDLAAAPEGSTFTLPPRISVGSLVVSAVSQATTCFKTADEVAKVLADDGTDTPFQLLCHNGAKMWTKARLVKLAPEGAVFAGVERLQAGALVVPASAASTTRSCLPTTTSVGMLIKDDGTSMMPYRVKCPSGGTWWHNLNDLKAAPPGSEFVSTGEEPDWGAALFVLVLILCCCCCGSQKEKRG